MLPINERARAKIDAMIAEEYERYERECEERIFDAAGPGWSLAGRLMRHIALRDAKE